MINIAICDDDVPMTATIESFLLRIGKEQNIKIDCEVFFDGSTIVESIRQGACYDLIYLDIEMPMVNGISAAELIRQMEVPALFIYVSSHENYAVEMSVTEPFRFVRKPIDERIFHEFFMAAYVRIGERSGYFPFTYNKAVRKIPLNRIYYFESQNRIVHIHTLKNGSAVSDDTENKFYGKMNDVERQLSERNGNFIRIHQSYLVNFDYIKSMNFDRVCMSDGTVLQISEDRQKAVRTLFCTMAGMEGRWNGLVQSVECPYDTFFFSNRKYLSACISQYKEEKLSEMVRLGSLWTFPVPGNGIYCWNATSYSHNKHWAGVLHL